MENISAGQFRGILATRYFSAAGITILILDHLLTLNRETQLVWPLKAGYLKWAFLVNRYLVPLVLVLFMHTLSGFSDRGLSHKVCNGWIVITCFLGMVSMSVSNSLILLKVQTLWDSKRNIIGANRLAFIVTQTGILVAMGFTAFEVLSKNTIRFSPQLKMCIITQNPVSWKSVWAITLGFDVFTFLMVCLNALSRPRGSHTLLMKVLYRDGLSFFLAVSALRVLNLVMAVSPNSSTLMLGICLIWSLVTTLVSRMIMNLRLVELVTRHTVSEAAMALTILG